MKFVIPGHPIAKARPRFYTRGSFVGTFDSQAKKKQQTRDLLTLQRNNADHKITINASNLPQDGSFACRMVFHMPIPDSWSSAQKNAKLWGLSTCDTKPDLDNMEKFYLDCMNGIVFKDDCQVVSLASRKQYSLTPKTEIEIMPFKTPTISEKTTEILKLFSPNDLMELIANVKELEDLYNMDATQVRELNEAVGGELREVFLVKVAITMSKIADKHAKSLRKINTKYPNFHKECEKIVKTGAL